MEELSESINKKDRKYKKDPELKNTVTEIKTLEGISSTLVDSEVQISDLEDKVMESTQGEQQGRIFKNKMRIG